MSSVKEETLRGVKWNAIERFSVQGIQFLLGLIMARLLSPSDYGTVAIVMIFTGFSQLFIDSGFGSALVRKEKCSEADYSTVFYFSFVVSLICYAALFISAPWIAGYFGIDILTPIIRVQSLSMVLNALVTVQMAKLKRDVNFKAIAQRGLLSSLVSGIFGVACAFVGCGVWSLVIQSLLGTLINLLFVWNYCHWFPKWMYSWASFHEMFSYGSKLLAAGFIESLYGHLNTFVIGKFFSSKDLGFYNRGVHLAQFPVTNINGVLQTVSFPVLAKIQKEKEHIVRVYRKYIKSSSLLIFFACCMLATIAKPLILIILSDKWAESILYLQIFSFAIMFDHICSINVNLLLVIGRSDLNLRLNIIKKSISIAILLASIPFGVIGICCSKIIYTQIAIYINTYYTGKLFHLGYKEQFKDYSGFFVLSVLSCLPAFLIITFCELPHIFGILIGLILPSTIYILLMKKNPVFVEVARTAGEKIPFLRKLTERL